MMDFPLSPVKSIHAISTKKLSLLVQNPKCQKTFPRIDVLYPATSNIPQHQFQAQQMDDNNAIKFNFTLRNSLDSPPVKPNRTGKEFKNILIGHPIYTTAEPQEKARQTVMFRKDCTLLKNGDGKDCRQKLMRRKVTDPDGKGKLCSPTTSEQESQRQRFRMSNFAFVSENFIEQTRVQGDSDDSPSLIKQTGLYHSQYLLNENIEKQPFPFGEQGKSINDEIDHFFDINFASGKSKVEPGKGKNSTISTEETEIEAQPLERKQIQERKLQTFIKKQDYPLTMKQNIVIGFAVGIAFMLIVLQLL